jgi:hypothetical protein
LFPHGSLVTRRRLPYRPLGDPYGAGPSKTAQLDSDRWHSLITQLHRGSGRRTRGLPSGLNVLQRQRDSTCDLLCNMSETTTFHRVVIMQMNHPITSSPQTLSQFTLCRRLIIGFLSHRLALFPPLHPPSDVICLNVQSDDVLVKRVISQVSGLVFFYHRSSGSREDVQKSKED